MTCVSPKSLFAAFLKRVHGTIRRVALASDRESFGRRCCPACSPGSGDLIGNRGEERLTLLPEVAALIYGARRVARPSRRWTGSASWRIAMLRQELAVRLAPVQGRGDVFDTSFWPWLESVTREEVNAFVSSIAKPSGHTWHLEVDDIDLPLNEAYACAQAHSAWPISFSYPRAMTEPRRGTRTFLSDTLPGVPYSFANESEYMESYRRAYFALTHRKGGWDCFRHLEILAAGSIPLMLDAANIPRFAMVHYPKRAMRRIVEHLRAAGDPPSDDSIARLGEFCRRHLTSAAMAKYMLTMAGLGDAERILFLDRVLPSSVDYQSVLTLIGLKQLRGADCHVVYPVSYIYADYRHPIERLYGRGFGYSRVVPSEHRSTSEQRGGRWRARRSIRHDDYDAVVIGSIARNGPAGYRLLEEFPASRTIWVHGEDQPPSPREMHFLRRAKTHLFIRSMPHCVEGALTSK